jgi:hypothetical protein
MVLPLELRKIPKSSTDDDKAETRSGRYHKSMFPEVKGYGDSRWVVGCYIEIDYPSLLNDMSELELIEGCLKQLNQIPPRKKFERKMTSSLYGCLEILSYKFKENNGQPFIEMLLITDDQKNENFWGEGISYANHKKPRRRSRKNQAISL